MKRPIGQLGRWSQRPIPLHETVNVGRVETLEDVLRLLESLDDLGERILPLRARIARLRTRTEPEKKQEQAKGRRFVG